MHPYFNKEFVIATKHSKEKILAPLLQSAFSSRLSLADVDTDQLGTFSGEIERKLSPLATAVEKAKLGIASSSIPYGFASEGTIGNDPAIPLIVSNIETMVLVDSERNLTISESIKSFDIVAASGKFGINANLEKFLKVADFPNHKLIVKDLEYDGKIPAIKGIDNLDDLKAAIRKITKQSNKPEALIENDFRAHCSPSRQVNIQKVMAKLIARMKQTCSECNSPGFGKTKLVTGLDCSECGTHKEGAIHKEILTCVLCEHEETGRIVAERLSPEYCDYCNP